MSFVRYNPNPERQSLTDCVIRAVSTVLDMSWDDAYVDLSMLGFSMKDMPNTNSVWGKYLKLNGFSRHTIPNTCPDCYTIRDFAYDHPTGIYVVATGSHAVAVINGDYYDTTDSGMEVPTYYWRKER